MTYWPVIAVSIERTLDSRKLSDARYSSGAAVGGAFGVGIDGIAVKAGLIGFAGDLERVEPAAAHCVVLGVGGLHQAAVLLALRRLQRRFEVQVFGLVAGRVHIA